MISRLPMIGSQSQVRMIVLVVVSAGFLCDRSVIAEEFTANYDDAVCMPIPFTVY